MIHLSHSNDFGCDHPSKQLYFSTKSLIEGDFIAAIPYALGTHVTTAPKLRPILKKTTTSKMPYLSSPMPTVISQPSSPKMGRVAGFHKDPVAGVSRPVNTAESWAAYHFETHAHKCAYCHNPSEVYQNHQQLCEVGHRLAQEVASFIYNKADGNTYSTLQEDNKPVRVEVPAGYVEVTSLLNAIERSLRRSRRSFVSMDRNYYVAPRAPASPPKRSASVKVSQEPKTKTKTSRPRSGEIVDWPDREPQSKPKAPRVLSEISNTANLKRGSLYEEDMAKRRATKNYAVEVREPTLRDIRDHRSSGYYR